MPSMPHSVVPPQGDTAADPIILGVDTHKDVHVAAVVNAMGMLLASPVVPDQRARL
jgi:transposase